MENEYIRKVLDDIYNTREEFYQFLDESIPKKGDGTDSYDFENAKGLDAKEVYKRFFKLDYESRKLKSIIYNLKKDL